MTMRLVFSETAHAIRERQQTVTRRFGSKYLPINPGTIIEAVSSDWMLICPIKVPLLGTLEVISVKPEPLRAIIDDIEYGQRELRLEGISSIISPSARVAQIFARHKAATLDSIMARIEFRYV